jgi:sporulation protein YlmC with PRC-barrel domain/CBS domain-containing protein
MLAEMINPVRVATSVSALVGVRVVDGAGALLGRVHEFAVDVSQAGTRVAALVLKRRADGKMHMSMLPVEQIAMPGEHASELVTQAEPVTVKDMNHYLLLERDLLDQQIIDVDGRKVVRVNDVNLAWSVGESGQTELLIEEVEVGTRGATRRLFKGLPAGTVDRLSGGFKARVIPWGCVDLIERDPARRVRLKIGQDRLARMHPSDIAEILADLAPAEREAVFSSLPEETAAEALEEVEPKLQKELLEGLDSERAAEILEEMDPAAAADALSELTDEQSDAILEEMEPEERQDIEELLEFEAESAAGRMTTDFLSVPMEATVADAVEALRTFEGDPDTITEIYLVGEKDKLTGVVMLPRLILSTGETRLDTLSDGHNVSCKMDASDKDVAELFDKYNLRSLPVVNHHGGIAGVIHAEQVIGQLLEA